MIIVTGGAGMIGSNVIAALNASGQRDILVIDDLSDGRKFMNLADLSIDDYMDKDVFLDRLKGGAKFGKVEAIYHQGACSATTEWNGSYMIANNYEYSKIIFSYAQSIRVPLVYASSAATYGNSAIFIESRENELPLNVYGYSKMLFDEYVRRRLSDLTAPVVGLRYFNVYGPREGHKDAMASVAYHLFKQVSIDGRVRLFGDYDGFRAGMQSRDFVHVEDVAAVNLWAAKSGASGIFNCGTGRARPFLAVAEAVIRTLGTGELEFIDFPEHLKGRYQSFTQADLTKLRDAGCPQTFRSVEDGVEQYVRWLMSRVSAGLPI